MDFMIWHLSFMYVCSIDYFFFFIPDPVLVIEQNNKGIF